MNTNPIPVPILYEPEADSCLFSGGLETKPTKIQASGGRKPPDSPSIDDRGLCLFFTSSKRKRRTNNALGNRIPSPLVYLFLTSRIFVRSHA